MKKIIHAAGLLTAGAATFCTTDSAFADDSGRRWTVGATTKGFYDDNIFTAADGSQAKMSSWGMDLSPYVNLNLPLDQTTITLGIQYGARWFATRPGEDWDQSLMINGNLSHNFSPRFKIDVNESFALAQEPEQLAPVGSPVVGTPFRVNGNNIRNNAGVNLTIQLSHPLSMVLGFQNNYYNFDDPGYSSVLNRIENIPSLNLRYDFGKSTIGVLGYQCAFVDYNGDMLASPLAHNPDERDNRSHYVFAGIDHNFSPRLLFSLRGGAQITEYYFTDPVKPNAETDTTPYFDVSLSYAYATHSTLQVGLRHTLNATDVNYNPFSTTLDQESTAVYAAINHSFSAKFSAGVNGLYQNSQFNGGGTGIDGQDENYWSVGVTATYKITRWLSAEANYYHDDLESNLAFPFVAAGDARSYSRNRVFFGFRFSY